MGRTPKGQTRERIFVFVRQRLLQGEPPTVRDVQRHFGFSAVQTARQHLEALVAEGRLEVSRGRSRGYRLPAGLGNDVISRDVSSRVSTKSGLRLLNPPLQEELDSPAAALEGMGPTRFVPVLGRIAAGPLTVALEELEGYVPIQWRNSADEFFALRVRGESMINAGILPEDLVVVRRQPTADSGDIVVAMVGEEATVKRLKKLDDRIELRPENPLYEPIVLPSSGATILGKVVEVRRYLAR